MAPTKRAAQPPLGKSKDPKKQANLFSFFKKTAAAPVSASNNAAGTATTAKLSTPSVARSSAATAAPAAAARAPSVQVGDDIEIYWKDDQCYYKARVIRQLDASTFAVRYADDGQCENVDLAHEQYRQLDPTPDAAAPLPQRKKKVVPPAATAADSDDEEMEMDDASSCDDDDEYAPNKNAADDDDDDDQWMVTDDEDDDDDDDVGKKKTKKKLKVTHHEVPPSSSKKTPAKQPNDFSSFASTSDSKRTPPPRVTPASAGSSNSVRSTPSLPGTSSSSSALMLSSASKHNDAVPMYVRNELNVAGSHVHNHLRFLRHPKDAQNRDATHPDYDPRTLQVDKAELERHLGGKITNAVQQWWDLKACYFDTVLLFKTGKFYELFHTDADVGVQHAHLSYMKGHVAHAGFPEVAYGSIAARLVRLGYKVARVEQTETPDMLAARKKRVPRGRPKPHVVNREVCSIMTLGTRTFCYLDDDGMLSSHHEIGGGGPPAVGPLLAIAEILLDDSTGDDNNDDDAMQDDTVRPVCEFGVTLVDAVHGVVTIGQFADDVLRSRMSTLLTAQAPCEILLHPSTSRELRSLIQSFQQTSLPSCRLETIGAHEQAPRSTALDAQVRRHMERLTPMVQPWDVDETLHELHRRNYYPKASKQNEAGGSDSVSRWPPVLRAAVQGGASLALASLGATLFYLQRNLIDAELLSMGIVKAYVPPSSTAVARSATAVEDMEQLAEQQSQAEAGVDMEGDATNSIGTHQAAQQPASFDDMHGAGDDSVNLEDGINHMSLDGTTLHNLEILHNIVDHKTSGSLWSKINFTKTPHGARLLRAWLLRPLFRKADIDRRADAVHELISGGAAVAMSEARNVLSKCGDIERLLSRVHSMSGVTTAEGNDDVSAADNNESNYHPNNRAILYEAGTYTKRKVGDFSKVLHGLRHAAQLPELFQSVQTESGLLRKIVCYTDGGGCFPCMDEALDFFFTNIDCDLAAKGHFEPNRGIDELYDEACDAIARIESEFKDYQNEMCANVLMPRSVARSGWKYINTKADSKDKYMIELPSGVQVPDDFFMKGKRGTGAKQVNKYRTPFVDQLVAELEQAIEVQRQRKARGLQLIFAKFDSMRSMWAAAAQASALLDALGSLAQVAGKAGYTRPTILECPPDVAPSIKVLQGRHPVVEDIMKTTEYVPNDLCLGTESSLGPPARVLLLSGPNMAGKSSLLRQTCLITILAQIGCFVPAAACELTPIDRIFTRLGASDRILLGQSTFFVELAETAAMLRGATRRSLTICDELGRGTSSFDGTAIASAALKHLVDRCKCLSLFATHYHSLLEDWRGQPNVCLGHMECLVENGQVTSRHADNSTADSAITFLYTLGEGACPKSFGVNVARMAGLPHDVLVNAQRISAEFEDSMNNDSVKGQDSVENQILRAIEGAQWQELKDLWSSMQ